MFYQEQIQASEQIIKKLNSYDHVCLKAPTQSGKTGAIIYTAMKSQYKHCFIITAMNQNAWIDQLKHDLLLAGLEKKDETIYYTRYEKSKFLQLCDKLTNKDPNKYFYLIKNNDFSLINMRLVGRDIKKNNTLLLVDESHYGQKPAQKLATQVINNPKLNKIVTVSATPTAELLGDSEVVTMNPGKNYVAIEHLLPNIRKSTQTVFSETFIQGLSKIKPQTYAIIRVSKGDLKNYTIQSIKQHIRQNLPHKQKQIIEVSSDNNNNLSSIQLEQKPNITTIVLIKDMGRLAERISTTHTSLMWDPSSRNQYDETVVQSLVGRATGYDKNRNIIIYTNKAAVESYIKGDIRNSPVATAIKSGFRGDIPTIHELNNLKNLNKKQITAEITKYMSENFNVDRKQYAIYGLNDDCTVGRYAKNIDKTGNNPVEYRKLFRDAYASSTQVKIGLGKNNFAVCLDKEKDQFYVTKKIAYTIAPQPKTDKSIWFNL